MCWRSPAERPADGPMMIEYHAVSELRAPTVLGCARSSRARRDAAPKRGVRTRAHTPSTSPLRSAEPSVGPRTRHRNIPSEQRRRAQSPRHTIIEHDRRAGRDLVAAPSQERRIDPLPTRPPRTPPDDVLSTNIATARARRNGHGVCVYEAFVVAPRSSSTLGLMKPLSDRARLRCAPPPSAQLDLLRLVRPV